MAIAILELVACVIAYGMLDKFEKNYKNRTVVIWNNGDGSEIQEEEVA